LEMALFDKNVLFGEHLLICSIFACQLLLSLS